MAQDVATERLGEEPYELVMLTGFEPADPYDLEAERRYATLMCPATEDKHGGTGTVRQAYTTAFEHVALKTMRMPNKLLFSEDEYAHELEMRLAAFREEYETLLKLRVMRAFPTVYGYGMLDGAPAIVMEWIEGTSFAELKGQLSPEQVTQLARATFFLLEQVESQVSVFVHRDLAPGNIIVRTSRTPLEEQLETSRVDLCLVDLGSTTVAREVGQSFTTRVGALRGATPNYAAPEMLSLETDADVRNSPKVDVYAASSVMWEMLTGSVPFDEKDLAKLLALKREGAPEANGLDLDEQGKNLAWVLAQGLDSNQETRPDAAMMRAWLDDLLTGNDGPWIEPANDATKTPLITRRRFLTFAGIAAGVAGIALIVPHIGDTLDVPGQPENEPEEDDDKVHGLSPDAPSADITDYAGALLPCLSSDGYWGFITTESKWAVPPIYQEVSYFSGGNAAVRSAENGLCGYINSMGKMTIEPQFKDALGFGQAGLAAARDEESGLWGYVDRTGVWSLTPAYLQAGEFTEMAPAQDSETLLWGYVNHAQEWVVIPTYGTGSTETAGAGALRNGLAPVCLSENVWTYMRYDGTLLEKTTYTSADEFFESYARVSSDKVFADSYLVDSSMGAYTSSEFTDVGCVSQGMFAARHTNGAWGFGEISGWRVAIPATFRGVGPFTRGLALARDFATRRWGYIDMWGNWVVEPIMSGVLDKLIVGGGIS